MTYQSTFGLTWTNAIPGVHYYVQGKTNLTDPFWDPLSPTLTATNSVPSPELTFDEGRAIVSSRLPQIGVSSRIYYTAGDDDEELLAITDSKVVRFGQANHGD